MQRFLNKEFESQPALAGTEEDTPYDFDHILPQSNWAGWTGIKGGDRLIDFAMDKRLDHSFLGNGIGNLRVWPASLNRGDGDASPAKKIGLIGRSDGNFDSTIMTQSCIDDGDQLKAWIGVSAEEGVQSKWDSDRAKAFQEAIELRTYALYLSFYHDLHFDDLKSEFQRALEQRVTDKSFIA